ncbi:hypothetical protein L7F22_012145 [Adiantum nelumboides]|nr:hypothetical protein [Adiantum nelumboides]
MYGWNPNPNSYTDRNPNLLVDCSHCRTPLMLPPGANSIRCAMCQQVTQIAPHNRAPAPSVPPPNPQQYAPSPPNPHGSKKAVICGISYRYSRYELKGCLNDAKCMKYLLMKTYQFPESSIILLTEDQTDRYKIPTKHNIKMAMYWLVKDCKPGDSLIFHYSGHGSQQRNRDGSEVDGYDETILPVDFETQGMIVDDDINMSLVRPLPHGVRLHAIIDACHSGTVLDLPFLCKMNSQGQYVWEDHRPRNGMWKGTNGGEAYCFSGCDDHQTSADTSALSQVTYTGAMTFCFIQAIERGHARTYRDLLNAMRQGIRNSDIGRNNGPVSSLIGMLLTGGSYNPNHVQEPQLTASYMFDIGNTFRI